MPANWPDRDWDSISVPKSPMRNVQSIKPVLKQINSYALFAAVRDRIAQQDGSVDTNIEMQSVRKALMNGMIGCAVAKRIIDFSSTIGELGVDDIPPLTDREKHATIARIVMAKA